MDIQLAANFAAILDLGHGITGQDRGIGQVDLVELHQPDNRLARNLQIDFLDCFFACLGFRCLKAHGRMMPDLGSIKRNGMPLGTGQRLLDRS